MPQRYGPWHRAYDLFRRWQRDGTWVRIVTICKRSRPAALPSSRPTTVSDVPEAA
ncbi:hypothetical protein [Streptomyces sp. Qhu-G9]|uniref:hypothetical protein n=1 Tax=Streptomyces sp. Qhu-G9 TaxID=3452799 RepID=UPI003AF750C3